MINNYYSNGFGGYKLRQMNKSQLPNPYGNLCLSYFIFDSLMKLGTDTWHPLQQIVDKTIESMSSVQEGDQSYWYHYCERMRTKGLNPTDLVSDRILKLKYHSQCKLEVLGASLQYDHRKEGLFICLSTSVQTEPKTNSPDSHRSKPWFHGLTNLFLAIGLSIKHIIRS
jgi:hypothetical protein